MWQNLLQKKLLHSDTSRATSEWWGFVGGALTPAVRSFHIFCIYNFYNQGGKDIFKMSGRHILEKFNLFLLHNGIWNTKNV